MASMIDQIRASKLPSNMMQFAARGALQVSPEENIEILVYLARHNKVFGETARMTLAGWDEKASIKAAGNPQTPAEVLDYFISGDNVRPGLLPALLENPSVSERQVQKLAVSALRATIEIMLKSPRTLAMKSVIETLKSNPYVNKEEAAKLRSVSAPPPPPAVTPAAASSPATAPAGETSLAQPSVSMENPESASELSGPEDEAAVSTYMAENAQAIAAEADKPFQAIGGIYDAGQDTAPAEHIETAPAAEPRVAAKKAQVPAVRENALQKINRLDVKGRIQLALKGNKEERSLLIRDGTKVVALAVLEAPKLSDGEVEKFASQKNVLEAVLRQIPLKRRFMKNYIIVRNLCANPRTPLDLGLGLMKNLLPADLKNISGNKDVSETIRKLALKMYKQKMDAANKK
jgi:hypothetical protein